MVRIHILALVFLITSSTQIIAQLQQPEAAPKIEVFNSGADNLGVIANSVNLFTGDLNLPLNLISIPGDGSLSLAVSIVYNSANIERLANIWNLDAPTSSLGLGWSMQNPMIIVDNMKTGARDDDKFYLIEGGKTIPLINQGINNGVKSYKTLLFTNWIINYYPTDEKWEIIKENGAKFIYGDKNSARNTVQWIVKLGNWIGSSSQTAGQSRQGSAWNLSEVNSLWGKKIQYTYDEVVQQVGSGGLYHTEASYLSKINDVWGNEIEFSYGNKTVNEYMEPHRESTEPDAYQEIYEKKFLTKLIVKKDGFSHYEINLGFDFIGSGSLTKRILKTITKIITLTGAVAPITSFGYLGSGAMYGALNSVSTSNGGNVTFDYHTGLELLHTRRDKHGILPPSGYETNFVTVAGDDFVVMTWRQLESGTHSNMPKDVQVYTHNWNGEWKEKQLGTIGNVTMLNGFNNFQFIARKDFFAFLTHDYSSGPTYCKLYIWHKAEHGWISSSHTVNMDYDLNLYTSPENYGGDGRDELYAGNDFIAVTNNKGRIYRFVWNGPDTKWTPDYTSESVNTHYVTAANNYIVSHDTGPNPDVITFYYLDESKTWQSKIITTTLNNGSDTYWYGSNAFALAMYSNSNEHIYKWDENYSITSLSTPYNTGISYPKSRIVITGGAQITMVQPYGLNPKIRSLRYDGEWNDSGDEIYYFDYITNYYHQSPSAGIDFFHWRASQLTGMKKRIFSPNSRTWLSPTTDSDLGFSRTADLEIETFLTPGGTVYDKSVDGIWKNLGGINNLSDGPENFEVVQMSNTTFVNKSGIIYLAKNGTLIRAQLLKDSWGSIGSYTILYGPPDRLQPVYLLGRTVLISRPTTQSNSFNLWKIVNDDAIWKLQDHPVVRVTVNDGIKNYYTSFDYEINTATFDITGSTAKYNKVTVIPGSSDVASKPYGYTENYFFNGLSESELGNVFYSTQEQSNNQTPESSITNASVDYNFLTGQSYRTKVFSALSTTAPVSETTRILKADYGFIERLNSSNIERAYLPQLVRTINNINGIQTHVNFGYDFYTKQLLGKTTEVRNEAGLQESYSEDYKYWWSIYSSVSAKNLLTPIAQVRKFKIWPTYEELECIVNRCQIWPSINNADGVPGFYDSYVWKRTGVVNSFSTTWSVYATPTSNWQFSGGVVSCDQNSGNVIDKQGSGGGYSTIKYDSKGLLILAETINALSNQVYYEGFEEMTTMVSSLAKVGSKSFASTSFSFVVKSAGNYKLTYWKRSQSGLWSLVETTVTATTPNYTIPLTNNAGELIDEVRLHPVDAEMKSFSYDKFGNLISVCDTNNIITYYEYDEFQRPKLTRDKDGNIINKTTYTFKSN